MRSVLKNKVLVSIIAILLMANIGLLVFFLSAMKKPEREKLGEKTNVHSTESFLQSKIGFSDAQISQFNQLKDEHHQKLLPLFEDLRNTKDKFFVLVKDSLSGSALDSLAGRALSGGHPSDRYHDCALCSRLHLHCLLNGIHGS